MDTHLIIIIAVYFVFTVIALFAEISRIKKTREIRIVSLCRGLFILANVFIPGVLFCGYLSDGIESLVFYDSWYTWTFYFGAFATIATYFMFSFGYNIKQKIISQKSPGNASKTTLLASIFVLISVVALILWASGYGGVQMLVAMANPIRAGAVRSTSNVAFFKHFVPLSLLASFLLFNRLVIARDSKSISEAAFLVFLFVISIAISIVYILANDGRLLAGVFVLLFFLLIIKNEYEVKKKSLAKILFKSAVLLMICLSIILNVDVLFKAFRGNTTLVEPTKEPIMQVLSKEFYFVASTVQTAIMNRAYGSAPLMIMNDIVNGLFAWLPTSIKPMILLDVWDYNTMLRNTGAPGQTPTTIVAQSIYDLGIIGFLIIPFFYGMIVKRVEKIFDSYQDNPFAKTVYVVLGFYLAKGMVYFSIYNLMINTFFIVFGWIIFLVLNNVKIRWNGRNREICLKSKNSSY